MSIHLIFLAVTHHCLNSPLSTFIVNISFVPRPKYNPPFLLNTKSSDSTIWATTKTLGSHAPSFFLVGGPFFAALYYSSVLGEWIVGILVALSVLSIIGCIFYTTFPPETQAQILVRFQSSYLPSLRTTVGLTMYVANAHVLFSQHDDIDIAVKREKQTHDEPQSLRSTWIAAIVTRDDPGEIEVLLSSTFEVYGNTFKWTKSALDKLEDTMQALKKEKGEGEKMLRDDGWLICTACEDGVGKATV